MDNNNASQPSALDVTPLSIFMSSQRRRCSTGDKSNLSSINEQPTTQKISESSKSVATTVSELDTLSEHSGTCQDEWNSPRYGNSSHDNGSHDNTDSKEPVVRKHVTTEEGLPSIAEAGNRLSQLELPEASHTNTALSIVDIAYDL